MDKLDLKHATVCLLIYGGSIILALAFWYVVFRLFCLVLPSWQAGVMTVLMIALAVAGVMRLADD
jgi:hypothetical protein